MPHGRFRPAAVLLAAVAASTASAAGTWPVDASPRSLAGDKFDCLSVPSTWSSAQADWCGKAKGIKVLALPPPANAFDCKAGIKVGPDADGCINVAVSAKCKASIDWARTTGIQQHPEWYPNMTHYSSFAAFQKHLSLTFEKKSGCQAPCAAGRTYASKEEWLRDKFAFCANEKKSQAEAHRTGAIAAGAVTSSTPPSTTTAAPTSTTTGAPTSTTTEAPTSTTTALPTSTTTATPTSTTTAAPTSTTTTLPTSTTTAAPTSTTTAAPTTTEAATNTTTSAQAPTITATATETPAATATPTSSSTAAPANTTTAAPTAAVTEAPTTTVTEAPTTTATEAPTTTATETPTTTVTEAPTSTGTTSSTAPPTETSTGTQTQTTTLPSTTSTTPVPTTTTLTATPTTTAVPTTATLTATTTTAAPTTTTLPATTTTTAMPTTTVTTVATSTSMLVVATTARRTAPATTVTQPRPAGVKGPCSVSQQYWVPLDMPGTALSVEADDRACQLRCARNPDCEHFSYYKDMGSCHMQSRFATLVPGQPGWISGPSSCSALRNAQLQAQRASARTQCFTDQSAYVPLDMLMSVPTIVSSGGMCQQSCQNDSRCKVFTFDPYTGFCHHQDASATLTKDAIFQTITGPAHCGGTAIGGVMAKFSAGGVAVEAAGRPVGVAAGAALAVAALLALFVSWRRSPAAAAAPQEEVEEAELLMQPLGV